MKQYQIVTSKEFTTIGQWSKEWCLLLTQDDLRRNKQCSKYHPHKTDFRITSHQFELASIVLYTVPTIPMVYRVLKGRNNAAYSAIIQMANAINSSSAG